MKHPRAVRLLLHPMFRWVACGVLLVASPSHGGAPSALNSTVPDHINLVGSAGGVADVHGQFTIVVRDVSSPTPQVCPFTPVVIDFNGCTPDIRVCSVQPLAGVTANCVSPIGKVSATTDANGMVVMRIVGGANGGSDGAGFKCASVYAGNPSVFLGSVNIGTFDENGVGGLTPVDFSLWLSDWGSLAYKGRSDYNGSHSLNPADLALILDVLLAAGSASSCAAYCH